jgi:AraC-like DNA-binding protein
LHGSAIIVRVDEVAARYREQAPPPAAAALAACAWAMDPGSPRARPVRVLPDAHVDLVWGRGIGAFVAGPDTTAQLSPVASGRPLRGLRLRRGAAAAVLGVPARELRDRRVPLAAVRELAGLPPVEDERLAPDAAPDDAGAALADLVAARRGRAGASERVAAALVGLAGDPALPVPALADRLGYSERQLRRIADDALGYGPTVLGRVLRLQRWLAAAEVPGAPGLAASAAAAGYADQAHLSRDCRALAGLPPAALLAERAAAGR